MRDSNDEELIARCRQGTPEAWRELVRRYDRFVFSIAMSTGLTAHGVPADAANQLAQLPAVAVLFAAFLGYNPIEHLLGVWRAPVLEDLPPLHGGIMGYRGLVRMGHNSQGSKAHVQCDGLMMDDRSRSDTWPDIQIQNPHVTVAHEAVVGKISDEQLFYLQSRGLSEEEAAAMIVNGFIEPISKELPMEYAVEMNRLIELQMEGPIG